MSKTNLSSAKSIDFTPLEKYTQDSRKKWFERSKVNASNDVAVASNGNIKCPKSPNKYAGKTFNSEKKI